MTLFRDLAEVFQRLERTSSNTALVSILAAFLSKLTPDEARAVAYLLRGEVAAPFAAQEIGMAERMVMRAMAEANAVPQRRVERLLATTGDLGTVAEDLSRGNRGRTRALLSVFEELRTIARIEGCIKSSRPMRLSQHIVSAKVADVERYFRDALAKGAEGVMIKAANGPYQAGKDAWLIPSFFVAFPYLACAAVCFPSAIGQNRVEANPLHGSCHQKSRGPKLAVDLICLKALREADALVK